MTRRLPAGERLPYEDIRRVAERSAAGEAVERPLLARAVRTLVAQLASDHPGHLIELRVPPFAAVQLGDGSGGVHTRGTPPNVVQTDAATLLGLAVGQISWVDAIALGGLKASGIRSDLRNWFPMPSLAPEAVG